jgi:two-component sensor histidine kinase
LKYAFPGNRRGEIKVNLFLSNNKEPVLEVSDNGVGLPEGFDIQKDIHLGLEIAIDLVEHQLGGKISFRNGQGLLWRILLKEELYEPRV